MNQEKIGKFIADLRKENNLTQEDLAEKMGVTSKSISRWENGKTMPDISMLGLLADSLNTTIQELLNGQKMTKEELIELKGTLENLIEYESDKQIKNSNKISKYILIGNLLILLAIINNHFNYLGFIFTTNVADFVHGVLYGLGMIFSIMGIWINYHNASLCEKKKQYIKSYKNNE